jgi:serine/threonine-protein kinase
VNSSTERLNTALAGRYKIEKQLGQGGMATVYLAQDLKHDRKVAVKVLKPELAAVLGAERFVVEIKTTAALQHPHILPLFDSGTADGFLYYVMPYIEGETLRGKLNRETQFSVDEAVRITSQVADALDYAHRHGVIHRDIKPENILLHDGRPMVADFGIALAVSAAAGGRMTETGLSLGTPHYMSPEQATAEKEITGRSDIYSLASVMYEMLAGQPPHLGGSAQQIIMKIIAEPVQVVTQHRKSVPHHVAAALAKALEKLPADRFESAAAFAAALGNSAFTGGTTTVARNSRSQRSNSKPILAAAGVALVLVGATIGFALTRRAPPTLQVVRFSVPMTNGQRLAIEGGYDIPLALSPDGTRLAYIARDAAQADGALHVRSLDQFTSTTIPGTENVLNPFYSPDGLWIGFTSPQERGLRKVAANGGPVSQVATDVALSYGAASWADDHSIVYMSRAAFPTRVGDGGGPANGLVDTTKVIAASPFVLPGSRSMLLTVCKRGETLAECTPELDVLDLKTGDLKVLVPNAARGWYLPQGYLIYSTREGALFAVKFDAKSRAITSAPVGVLDGINVGRNWIAHVAISASGTMAYVPKSATGNGVIVQVDRDGRETVIVAKPGAYSQPRISPDGQRIALTMPDSKQAFEIWIHDRSSATTRQLTFDGESERSAWSPDGQRLAFFSRRAGKGGIWVAPGDGSGPGARLGDSPNMTGSAAVSWTRDGKWVVWDGQFDSQRGAGVDDIYAIPVVDTPHTPHPVVATPYGEQTGEVSPDGKWIAYISNDANRNQVYIQPFMSPGGRTLISAGAATEPAWVSNNELAYVNNETDSLTVARLEFGATIKVTRKALIHRAPYQPGSAGFRGYDVTRDGKSFVFVKPVGQATAIEPVVVLNWAEEVKRLMAAAGIK